MQKVENNGDGVSASRGRMVRNIVLCAKKTSEAKVSVFSSGNKFKKYRLWRKWHQTSAKNRFTAKSIEYIFNDI
jgi:hypothetical protein